MASQSPSSSVISLAAAAGSSKAEEAAEGSAANKSGTGSNSSTNSEDSARCCWVCFATDADDRLAAWVQPCNCIGTTKWVHQWCLQRWVDEKQRGNISRKVLCPQCRAEYIVVFPSMGALVSTLDALEELTHKIYPFIAGGVMLGSIYWSAITFGAVTVMQVVGHSEGLQMMEAADPLVLLILLPSIPATLVSANMYNWEDSVLTLLRKYCTKIPALGCLLPFGRVEGSNGNTVSVPELNNGTTPTRIFCSALLLPTISTLVGKILFNSIQNNLHRTVLGGLTYITIKGALKIYHKQMLYIRHSSRKILDYTEANLKEYRNLNSQVASSSSVARRRDVADDEQVV